MVGVTAAIQCLKRKKLYEVQVEQLGNFQLRIHDQVWHYITVPVFLVMVSRLQAVETGNSDYQLFLCFSTTTFVHCSCTPTVSDLFLFLLLCCEQMIMLEGAKATTETVDALRSGASAMKAIQKATYAFLFLLPQYLRIKCYASACFSCNCTHILSVETIEVQFDHFKQKRGCVCLKKLTACCHALQKY